VGFGISCVLLFYEITDLDGMTQVIS